MVLLHGYRAWHWLHRLIFIAEGQKGEPMKIRVTEYTTEIEADARELRESNTLGGNVALLLQRCFRSNEPFDDDEVEETDE